MRSFFDPDHLLEVHRGLCLPFHHPFDHRKDRVLSEVVFHLPPSGCLALVHDRPCRDPILAPLCDFLYICLPFLLHDNRDWLNRYLPRTHAEKTYGEAIVIFFARLALYLGRSLVRGLDGGHHGLLSNPESDVLGLLKGVR